MSSILPRTPTGKGFLENDIKSKLLSNYPSSLPVSSSKLQGGKRPNLADGPAPQFSSMHSRKHSLTFNDTQSLPRSSSIPLRIGSTSYKSSASLQNTPPIKTSPSKYAISPGQRRHDVPSTRVSLDPKASLTSSSTIMNPTAASSMRSSVQKRQSTEFSASPLKIKSAVSRSPLKPPVSGGSPKHKNSSLLPHQHKRVSSPTSPFASSHAKAHPMSNFAHTRKSLPPSKPASTVYPDFPDSKLKRHSLARPSGPIENSVTRNTHLSSISSFDSPSEDLCSTSKDKPRYSASYLTTPPKTKKCVSSDSLSKLNDKLPPVPPLPSGALFGKNSLHTSYAEKQKAKARLSMQIPPATTARHINARKSVGHDLHLIESLKDCKYPDFPTEKPVHPPSSAMPPPKSSNKTRPQPNVQHPRQLPMPPKSPRTEINSTKPTASSKTSIIRRNSVISTHKQVTTSKSTSSFNTSTCSPRKSSVSSRSISTTESVSAKSEAQEMDPNYPSPPSIIKSNTIANLSAQIKPSSSTTLARSNTTKRINFNSPAKSPYRPLNRPAHVYPQINKKSSATEEDNSEKGNSLKMRSKSTAAKQRTILGSSLISGSASRLLISPFSSEFRRDKNAKTPTTKQEPSRRIVSGGRINSPLEHMEVLTEDEKKIQSIMKSLVKTMPDEDRSLRRYEEAKRSGTLIKEAMTPSVAAKTHRLNMYERGEILDYRNVYFCGRSDAKKISGDIRHASNNYGFDDNNGDYQVVKGDHIAYRYEILGVLGKGSFGKVLKCIDHKSGKLVAVKMIINRKRFHMQALIEADILRALSQWDVKDKYHLIRYTAHFNFRDHLCISTELLGVNLYELLKLNKFKGLPIKLVQHFSKQLLEGLRFLDHKEIIHCDLKPENILLSDPERGFVKIIDFGSSCNVSEKVYTYIQSRFYRSPEVILGMVYDQRIDIWSLGCIIAELVTGSPLFMGENEQEQIACIMEIFGVPEKYMISQCSRRKLFFDSVGNPVIHTSSKNVKRYPGTKSLKKVMKTKDDLLVDFISQCLIWNPKYRLAPYHGLHHEFIVGEGGQSKDRHMVTRKASHSSVNSLSSINLPILEPSLNPSLASPGLTSSSGGYDTHKVQGSLTKSHVPTTLYKEQRPLPRIPTEDFHNSRRESAPVQKSKLPGESSVRRSMAPNAMKHGSTAYSSTTHILPTPPSFESAVQGHSSTVI